MNCIVCHNPGSALCQSCCDLEYPEIIRTYCLNATSKSPLHMAAEIMSHPGFPIAGQAHHPLIAAVLVTAFRNAGGDLPYEKIDEAVRRGNSIPGGFCAGFGADAAAIACGIAMSVIKGNTIGAEHAPGRAQAHALTGEGMLNVANNSGNRCCKRSVYSMLELATNYFIRVLGMPMEVPERHVTCPFPAQNKLCNGPTCKYHPA